MAIIFKPFVVHSSKIDNIPVSAGQLLIVYDTGDVYYDHSDDIRYVISSIKEWQSNKRYKNGSLIIYNNKIYICLNTHISTDTFDDTKFKMLAGGGGGGASVWSANTNYKVDDLVSYTDRLYRCTEAHTSSSNFEIEYWVALNAGPAGEPGATGPAGEPGAAFTFDMFTEDQLASLKGPKGDTGDPGPKGDPGDDLKLDKSYDSEEDMQDDFDNMDLGSIVIISSSAKVFKKTETEWEFMCSFKGEKGDTGAQGKSAYDVAVEQGFEGEADDWLAGLKGDSAYVIAVEGGFQGDTEAWLASLKGDQGEQGDSAFTIAQQKGFQGNEEEWLAGLKGDSAYKVAVDAGFSGNEAAWIASLKGEKGDTGESPVIEAEKNEGILTITITNIGDNVDPIIVTLNDGITTVESNAVLYQKTLLAEDWTYQTENTLPYVQMINLSSITEDLSPFVDLNISDDIELGLQEQEEWGYVTRAETGNGTITFYCYEEKPSIDLNINIKAV